MPAMHQVPRRLQIEMCRCGFLQIQHDLVGSAGAHTTQRAAEATLHRPMQMPAEQALYLLMASDERFQRSSIDKLLAVHVADAGDKRRMMENQQRWYIGATGQLLIEPAQLAVQHLTAMGARPGRVQADQAHRCS